jgi:hypothetical protein
MKQHHTVAVAEQLMNQYEIVVCKGPLKEAQEACYTGDKLRQFSTRNAALHPYRLALYIIRKPLLMNHGLRA